MKGIRLVNYTVKGIKSLDEDVSLSFYKKTFSSKLEDFQKYNIKGIYGINGSGKTAIITSVKIFKNLIVNRDYLNNPIIQSHLDALVNSKLQKMDFCGEFYINFENKPNLYRYEISIKKGERERIIIDREMLAYRGAFRRKEDMKKLFEINDGEIVFVDTKDQKFENLLIERTKNLLKESTMSSIILDYFREHRYKNAFTEDPVSEGIALLLLFGVKIFVHMDNGDDHSDYFLDGALYDSKNFAQKGLKDNLNQILKTIRDINKIRNNEITYNRMLVPKRQYKEFERRVSRLFDFISVFKKDLKRITIDKREDTNSYICDLIMDYEKYKINAEFESTGIKKLIELYEYFDRMKTGSIVFIDELDSNLHDVYLCALLEFLMEYGEGQLCFTSHNIGPMNILKRNQKSIDFLSENHKIYSWAKNGNYQPERLYRSGMIEGSPFNIDSTDFISAFANEEGEE